MIRYFCDACEEYISLTEKDCYFPKITCERQVSGAPIIANMCLCRECATEMHDAILDRLGEIRDRNNEEGEDDETD